MGQPLTAAVRFLSGEREPVRVATTGNIELSGLQTIDGVALSIGERVLVKDQTDATENGIRLASEGEWFRASDASQTRAINEGVTVQVRDGTVNGGREYKFTSSDPRVGTDAITLAWSGPQAAQEGAETAQAAAEAALAAAEAAQAAAEAAAAGVNLPSVAPDRMLVDNAAGTARESKTFQEVRAALGLFDTDADFTGSDISGALNFIDVSGDEEAGDGGAKRMWKLPSEPSTVEPWHRNVDGKWFDLGEPNGKTISVKAFGARLSGSQTPAQRLGKIQAAIDWAAERGYRVYIPAGTWVIDGVLKWHSGSVIDGAGMDLTILQFSTTAHEDLNMLEPSAYDMSVGGARISNLTCDGNRTARVSAGTVTGVGTQRPGSSGVASMSAHDCVFYRVRSIGHVLHCFDDCAGGDLDGGNRKYLYPEGPTLYSTTPSKNNAYIECEAADWSDDGFTSHYDQNVLFLRCRAVGGSTYYAANINGSCCFEFDDGTFGGAAIDCYAEGSARGIFAKNHGGVPVASYIRIERNEVVGCGVGITVASHADTDDTIRGIEYDIINNVVRDPVQLPGRSITMYAYRIAGVDGVRCRGNKAIAPAGTTGLNTAFYVYPLSTRVIIDDYYVENWPGETDAGATVLDPEGTDPSGEEITPDNRGGIRIAGGSEVQIGAGRIINPGAYGINGTGTLVGPGYSRSIGPVRIEGTGTVASSIGIYSSGTTTPGTIMASIYGMTVSMKIGTAEYTQNEILRLGGNAIAILPTAASGDDSSSAASTAWVLARMTERESIINVLSPTRGVNLAGGTTAARTTAIQAAIDSAAALGKVIFFPAATYNVSGLKFPSGAMIMTEGVDRTIFRLADDAPELSNVWEPATRDGTTTNVTFIGDFTCDGNYARATVTGEAYAAGAPRPAASCFVTAGAVGLNILGIIKVTGGVLHGLDVCSGGETDLGLTNYVTAANLSPTYYPANMSSGIYINHVIGDDCGDDAVTGHYAHLVRIGKAVVLSAGNRHPDPQASNGPEVDDGCFDWDITWAEAHDCNMGVASKCHSDNPAPRDIHFGTVKVNGCARSFMADDPNIVKWDNHNITVGRIIIENPAQIQTTSPYQVYGAVFSGINNFSCGPINIVGAGSSLFNVGGTDYLRAAVQVDDGCRNWSIASINVRGWASGNITQTSALILLVGSDVNPGHIGPVNGYDCGYRGVNLNSAFDMSIGPIKLENPSLLAGSVALSMGNTSRNQRSSVDLVSAINYETRVTYGASTVKNALRTTPGDFRVGGIFGLDGASTKTISGDAITLDAGDGSFLRIDTEAAAATDTLSTINGGNDGDELTICIVSNSRSVLFDIGAGNLGGPADFTLTNTNSVVKAFRHAGIWKFYTRI